MIHALANSPSAQIFALIAAIGAGVPAFLAVDAARAGYRRRQGGGQR